MEKINLDLGSVTTYTERAKVIKAKIDDFTYLIATCDIANVNEIEYIKNTVCKSLSIRIHELGISIEDKKDWNTILFLSQIESLEDGLEELLTSVDNEAYYVAARKYHQLLVNAEYMNTMVTEYINNLLNKYKNKE
jgi:hypothetical protein